MAYNVREFFYTERETLGESIQDYTKESYFMVTKITHNFLRTAILLSRMYGNAETLEPLPRLSTEEICQTIIRWTEEYQNNQKEDILHFFVKKIHSLPD